MLLLRDYDWLEMLSHGIGIQLIFRPRNWNQLKKLESESIYSFNWNLFFTWNRNQFFALESESISFYASESESNYCRGESILDPLWQYPFTGIGACPHLTSTNNRQVNRSQNIAGKCVFINLLELSIELLSFHFMRRCTCQNYVSVVIVILNLPLVLQCSQYLYMTPPP